MSDRPAPLSTTDQYLGLVLDELQGLRADLAGRGGSTPAPTPQAAKRPASKKTTSRTKSVDVDGT